MNTEDNDLPAFYKLATRYLVGEASSRERDHMVKMLQQPTHQRLFKAMQSEFEGTATPGDDDFGLDEVKQRLSELTSSDEKIVVKPSRSPFVWRPWLLIACSSIAIVISIVGLKTGRAPLTQQTSGTAWVTYATTAKERLYLTLHDNSTVILNADSTISFPDSFDALSRTVRLSGEAYFEVSKNESCPFIVETNTIRITVLGTRFNVRAFNDGSQARVSLLSGRVKVAGIGPAGELAPVEMTPGLQYSFTAETGEGKVEPVSTETTIKWTKASEPPVSPKNPLIFDQEALDSVAQKLGERFNVLVKINSTTLGLKKITGRFQNGSLEDILKILRMAGAFEYQFVWKDGKTDQVILSDPLVPPLLSEE